MTTVEHELEPLVSGDYLSREEFLRRWEHMPQIKRAELIGGIVYMPSPVSIEHGENDNPITTWLGMYAAFTPGCKAGNNTTWLMLEDAPQTDGHLRILPEYGGQSWVEGVFGGGAPELAAEVSRSSTSYDLHQKRDLYEQAGVQEYIVVLVREREVRWHRLVNGRYQLVPAPADGVLQSAVFPGLWLHVPALLAGDSRQVLETLQRGLGSAEHSSFVARLQAKATPGSP
jgi:Uma2 family endonuclease